MFSFTSVYHYNAISFFLKYFQKNAHFKLCARRQMPICPPIRIWSNRIYCVISIGFWRSPKIDACISPLQESAGIEPGGDLRTYTHTLALVLTVWQTIRTS